MDTIINELINLLEEKKCVRIKSLDMAEVTCLADYVVLGDARNKKHAQAIADYVTEFMKNHSTPLLRENGYRDGGWILQDFGDIIVHIFTPEERDYYDLDTMWGDAPLTSSTGD